MHPVHKISTGQQWDKPCHDKIPVRRERVVVGWVSAQRVTQHDNDFPRTLGYAAETRLTQPTRSENIVMAGRVPAIHRAALFWDDASGNVGATVRTAEAGASWMAGTSPLLSGSAQGQFLLPAVVDDNGGRFVEIMERSEMHQVGPDETGEREQAGG